MSLDNAYARGGKTTLAINLARKPEEVSKARYTNPYWFVILYSGFEDDEKTLQWLAEAVHQHACTALDINTDERLDFLRHNPRFLQIVSEMHLPN